MKHSKAVILSAFVATAFTSSASAQDGSIGPIQAVAVVKPVAAGKMSSLPANTEILVRMNEEITTKKNNEGDTFYLTVVHDVLLNGYVVVPKGARAVGAITWRTGKGAFGKSGKMDIEIQYVEVGGQRVPVIGKFRQEGEGNTVATVAAVALVWVAAPFITGKSGLIPAGRELMVHTRDDMPVTLPEVATVKVDPAVVIPPAEVEAPSI